MVTVAFLIGNQRFHSTCQDANEVQTELQTYLTQLVCFVPEFDVKKGVPYDGVLLICVNTWHIVLVLVI